MSCEEGNTLKFIGWAYQYNEEIIVYQCELCHSLVTEQELDNESTN